MEAKAYTLCLIGDDVKDEFLAEIGDSYEILSFHRNIPSLLKLNLTEVQREELLNHPYVIEIEQERESTPASLFTFGNASDKNVTIQGPNDFSEPGSNYISAIHKYFTNGVTSTNPNGVRSVGAKGDFFNPSIPGCDYASYLTGEHVDIVTVEAPDNFAPNNHHKTNPDYHFPGTTNTRCVPMDWSQYSSDITESVNTNQSSNMLSNHGAGVLSCAGGIYGGLAKKASLRQISIVDTRDTVIDCIDAIKAWHNSKQNNPVTGQKNPTIVIGEFQYVLGNESAIKIKDIASFTVRGTTTNRPDSTRNPDLNGWKLSDFVDKNMLPKLVPVNSGLSDSELGVGGVSESSFEWCITFYSSGQNVALRNAIEGMISDGIHWICAAGNDCAVFSKYDSEDYDNKITTTTNYNYHDFYDSYEPQPKTNGPQDYFIHRSYGPSGMPNAIDVGARQRSEEVPAVDGYTARGPVVDIFGLGDGTWSSYSGRGSAYYGDGHKWGLFAGTSAATPTVVGVAACILEYQYLTTGSYPNPATLKSLLLGTAEQSGIKNYETIDWDADPSPEAKQEGYTATNLVFEPDLALIVPSKAFQNGGIIASDLVGASTRGAFLPDVYRTYNPDTGQATPTPTPSVPSPTGPCIHPTIKGPTGNLSSPPYNYAQSYDKYEGGRGNPGGIYFQPQGEESNYPPENISYVAFRLRMRSFGPRGGNGETIYLTSNRGNRDPNKGTVRKWYTEHQSVVDREPDKWTTNRGEAFVPFRIHFRVGFVAGGDGAYRILYSNHYHDWSSFEYKDIDFDSTEMARQNKLPTDGSGKIIFPDFGTKNYTQPRIFEIKSDIYNLDLNPNEGERKNRINMFAQATNDSNKAKESQVLEFGKYIIQ